MSRDVGMTTTSKGGWPWRYWTSFRTSFAWNPSSPRRVETVRSPRSFGSTETPRPVAARMTAGMSQRKSSTAGVLRRRGTCCSR